jgi:hypothetical protein
MTNENKFVEEAFAFSLYRVVKYAMANYSELLAYAKKQHNIYGRGYLSCSFGSYTQMTLSRSVEIVYITKRSGQYLRSPQELKSIDTYDPETEFLLDIVCKFVREEESDNERSNSRYMFRKIDKIAAIEYMADQLDDSNYSDPKEKAMFQLGVLLNNNLFERCCKKLAVQRLFKKRILVDGDLLKAMIKETGKKSSAQAGVILIHGTTRDKTIFYCPVCEKDLNNEAFKRCASCKMVGYCGPDCQKKDWKEHKNVCKKWTFIGEQK